MSKKAATGQPLPPAPGRRKVSPPVKPAEALDFIAGGGEMGARLRDFDWSQHPLGLPESWEQSLRTAVNLMLNSRYPMFVWWGKQLFNFYNDAYTPMLGKRHPAALGQPAAAIWSEIWDVVGPQTDIVLNTGRATWNEEQLLVMERNGFVEEAYFSFSYSPVLDDARRPGGIFCAVTEDTGRVLGRRRLRTLRDLAVATVGARSEAEACRQATGALETNRHDLPFALIYLLDEQIMSARLVSTTGIAAGGAASPLEISLSETSTPWPLDLVFRSGHSDVLRPLPSGLGPLPGGPWPDSPTSAIILPIRQPSQDAPVGFFIAGISARLAIDDDYLDFLALLAGQIGTAISDAGAYEAEHRRAEALAEIDQAKTAFFSNVSHEFRTPLTLMLGPIEDLLNSSSGSMTEAARERLSVAHRNSLRLLKLVNTLLDFSRIEAGRVQAIYEPTDLAHLTEEFASNFRSACDRAGLGLVVECETLPERIHVDRDMWEKIVLNLVSNAFKFTFEGAIVVRLRALTGAAELVVRDTGVGVPAHELPRLFERFHRIEGQKGRSFEGSGIGLALVQELVRLHGGTIAVGSEVGKGTAFTVTVPFGTDHLPAERIGGERKPALTALRAEAYVEEALRWLPDEAARSTPILNDGAGDPAVPAFTSAGASKHVLVADDNSDMRDYVRRLLGDHCEVEAVADGRAALDAIRRRIPDLVIADVMMPRLDGFGLLREIRADSRLRLLPVIMLSARAGEEARIEGLNAGADDYIVKPFSSRELITKVGSNLQMARLRREGEVALREEARTLEILNRVGFTVAAELDLERSVQVVTDAATELTGAAFGSFFYNVENEQGESYMLYTLSGAPREAFSKLPLPRNSALFAPTFAGEGIVRSDDVLKDPRYGKNEPYFGMPKGHLAVRSYLAAPVISRSGEVLGGLFFGHPDPGVFTERSERLLAGIAAQAAVAIDNGRLYQAAKAEIAERGRAAQALREGEERLQQANTELGRRLEEIQTVHAEVQDARRAALNLMEDAVDSRQVAETLNTALRDSERRFREMIDALPTAVYTTDAEGRITHFNPAAVDFTGRTPKLGTDQWCVSWKLYHPDGRPMPHDECPMAVALKEGRAVRGVEAIIERPDGSRRWFLPYPTPLRDHEGRITGGINMLVDITERKQAEMVTASLAAIVRSSDDAIISKDLNGIIETWNTGAERLFGYMAEEAIGKPIAMLIPPDRLQEEPEILARLRRGEHLEHFETVRIRKDGSQVEVSLTISPVKDSSGRIVGASKIARDITERNAAQRREQVLTRELAHRTKNLLGVVQALVSRSVSGERSLDEAREVLSQRIHALARSQSVLVGGAFEGASVAEIIRLEFEAFSGRVDADGPDTILTPKAAQMFALVVHELATNATKYGALSNPAGRVAIRWSIEGQGPEARFTFRWQERGGPPVKPPAGQGFGRVLIEQAAAQDFQSSPQIRFAPEGLSYEIDAPLSAVAGR
jgi:PAS domain S-box-containing protein